MTKKTKNADRNRPEMTTPRCFAPDVSRHFQRAATATTAAPLLRVRLSRSGHPPLAASLASGGGARIGRREPLEQAFACIYLSTITSSRPVDPQQRANARRCRIPTQPIQPTHDGRRARPGASMGGDGRLWVRQEYRREPSRAPSRQGLTLVHFSSAQLEPCLTDKNTLHPLDTP